MAGADNVTGSVSSGSSCLGVAGKSLCDFFDADLIASYLPEVEPNGYRDTKRSILSGCGYSKDHSTKTVAIKVGTINMNAPATYVISLNSVRSSKSAAAARSLFNSTYKTMTPAEAEATRERVDAGVQRQLDAGELTAEQAKLAKGFGSMAGKARWEKVSGVGDAAVWGSSDPEREPAQSGVLAVLHGDTQFHLNVDLLESRDHSRAAAVAIAKSIIARCD